MIKILFTTLILLLSGLNLLADPTPNVVSVYYSSLKELETKDVNEAFDITNNLKSCFAGISRNDNVSGFSGINIVDFIQKDTTSSNNFVARLEQRIHKDRTLGLSKSKIQSSTVSMQPEMYAEDKEKDVIIQTVVNTQYWYTDESAFSIKRNINQTEYLAVVNNKIVRLGTEEFNLDVVSITIRAAQLYSLKKFKEAYNLYEEALKIEPNNVNVLFRMGVMVAKGQGIRKDYKKAKEYFTKIMNMSSTDAKTDFMYEFYYLRDKAKMAYYYLTHPQV